MTKAAFRNSPNIYSFIKIVSIFVFMVLIPLFCFSRCYAEDISFEVNIDKNKVYLGDTIQLNLSFYGAQNVSAVDLPKIEGFRANYLGPSTRMSIVNGQVASSITHIYTLLPLKTGEFEIPPITVEFKGEKYTSQAISVEVIQPGNSQVTSNTDEGSQSEMQELKDRVFIVMEVDKKKVYVNEIIPVTIKLYINNLAIKDIQYPVFAHDGFSAEEFKEYKQYRTVLSGILYDVIEFNTNIFALRPGELNLGPAELKCNLLIKEQPRRRQRSSIFDDDFFGADIFDDFFGSYQKYPLDLESADISINVSPLPQGSVPDGFTGALGNYEFQLEAEPKEVKVGDPITLRMVISGEGNFKTVNAPKLNITENFKVYDPEIIQNKTNKVFQQVIIPKNDSVSQIPEIKFSFFDTKTGGYRTIANGPIPIKVTPLAEGDELKVFELPGPDIKEKSIKEKLGRDIIFIKDTPGDLKKRGDSLYKNKFFLALQFLPLLAVLFTFFYHKKKMRLETDLRYARRLRAPRKARKNLIRVKNLLDSKEPDEFFAAVFKTLQEYLGDKFHLPIAGITSSVVDELKKRGMDEKTLEKLTQCFNNCDYARYAPLAVNKEQMRNTLELLQEIIDFSERLKI